MVFLLVKIRAAYYISYIGPTNLFVQLNIRSKITLLLGSLEFKKLHAETNLPKETQNYNLGLGEVPSNFLANIGLLTSSL